MKLKTKRNLMLLGLIIISMSVFGIGIQSVPSLTPESAEIVGVMFILLFSAIISVGSAIALFHRIWIDQE